MPRREVVEPATEQVDPVDGVRDGQPVAPVRRRGYWRRPSADVTAEERAASTVDHGLVLIRAIRLVLAIVVTIIALAIIFVLLGANTSNGIVSTIRDWAHSLAGPFDGIFTLHSAKVSIALNYVIAIVIYTIVAELIVYAIDAALTPALRRARQPRA
jgi:hypothetical protein